MEIEPLLDDELEDDLGGWHMYTRKRSSFAWPGWLPHGVVTLLVGNPGQGKSALALHLCRTFTRGTPWPDGSRWRGQRGRVLWCESESTQQLNAERAWDWGIPTKLVRSPLPDPDVNIQLDLPQHREALARALARESIRFAVVDSLRGAHKGDENSSKSSEVLAFLAELARNTGKPILVTHHLRKQGSRSGPIELDRVRGSSSLTQFCRMTWAVELDAASPKKFKLHVIKNSIGDDPSPLFFRITSRGLVFHGEEGQEPVPVRPLERACNLLRSMLREGPVSAAQVESVCRGAGLSWSTVKRAKQRLGLSAVKEAGEGRWFWHSPVTQKQEGQYGAQNGSQQDALNDYYDEGDYL